MSVKRSSRTSTSSRACLVPGSSISTPSDAPFSSIRSRLYPCGECAAHFQTLLKEYPPQVRPPPPALVFAIADQLRSSCPPDLISQVSITMAMLPSQPSQHPPAQAAIRLPHPRRDVRLWLRRGRVDQSPCADRAGRQQDVAQRSEGQGRRQGSGRG